MHNLSRLSLSTLATLAGRGDLTAAMQAAIADELRRRRQAREDTDRASLAAYYAGSVGGSVLNDYRAGNTKIINAE